MLPVCGLKVNEAFWRPVDNYFTYANEFIPSFIVVSCAYVMYALLIMATLPQLMEIYPDAVPAAKRNLKIKLKEAKDTITWIEGPYREQWNVLINATHFKKQPQVIQEVNGWIAEYTNDLERDIKRYEYDLRFLESIRTGETMQPSKNGVSDEQIERAKQYPIQDLVKVVRKTTACLWHEDKHPSMHVYADNHAFCYVCPRRADAIDIQMAISNMTFIDAVRTLAP